MGLDEHWLDEHWNGGGRYLSVGDHFATVESYKATGEDQLLGIYEDHATMEVGSIVQEDLPQRE